MVPKGTPLIVIDMQNGFLNKRSDYVIPEVRRLAEKWIELGWPIYFTRFFNGKDSQWQEWLDWHRLQGPPETDISDSLADLVPHGIIMDKWCYTSMSGVVADAMLSDGWEAAVLCGVATDGCVMETAVDLFQRRVRPIVVTDACSSHAGDEVHQMGLHLLKRSIGPKQLVASDDLIDSLQ